MPAGRCEVGSIYRLNFIKCEGQSFAVKLSTKLGRPLTLVSYSDDDLTFISTNFRGRNHARTAQRLPHYMLGQSTIAAPSGIKSSLRSVQIVDTISDATGNSSGMQFMIQLRKCLSHHAARKGMSTPLEITSTYQVIA